MILRVFMSFSSILRVLNFAFGEAGFINRMRPLHMHGTPHKQWMVSLCPDRGKRSCKNKKAGPLFQMIQAYSNYAIILKPATH